MFQTKKNKKKRQEEKFAKYKIKRQSFRHKYEKITKTEMEKITKRSSWCDSKEFFRKKEEKRKEKIQQNEEELINYTREKFDEEFPIHVPNKEEQKKRGKKRNMLNII